MSGDLVERERERAETTFRLYVATIEEFGRFADELIAKVAAGGDARDLLEIIGDTMNNRDQVDEESIEAWEAARKVAERQRERLAAAEAVCDVISNTRDEPDVDWWDEVLEAHDFWREVSGR